MNDSKDVLMASAILGRDAEDWARSPIGQYLIGRAKQESQDAMEQLKKVSPWRRNRIKDLQAQIWRADSVETWLCELIVEGQQAIKVLDSQEQSE